MVTYNQVQEMLCNGYYLTYNDLDNNLINAETIIFNNLVKTKIDYIKNWESKIENSWLLQFIK